MSGASSETRETEADLLVPGARRMRPDDHFMLLSETDTTPMHVGAVLLLEVPEAKKADFYDTIRRHIAERLPHTPLLVGVRQAPEGYDSDVWLDLPNCDLDYHFRRVPGEGAMDDRQLYAFIADEIMQRLDMSKPPFEVHVLDRLTGDRCGLYIKVHHAITDGIGFQTILGMLSDEYPPAKPRTEEGRLPSKEEWRRLADERFAREAPVVAEMKTRRKAALAALEEINADPARQRARTPTLKLSGPTSSKRAYSTVSIPLARIKDLSKRYDGTINDMFLAVASSAVRRYLLEIDDLPDTPIVINSARSYRRPEHGQFGNRIVALHPHLGTDIADPVKRLRAIQASMAVERARTEYDEAMLGQLETPYGARNRREKFAARLQSGGALLPGNITLSNVPGPAEPRSYAGFRQVANFPTPLLGSGRFLNVTSRRNGDYLDMGVMVDPAKVPDPAKIGRYLLEAVEEYEHLAQRM